LWVAPAATTAPAPAPSPWDRLLELERRISAPGDEEPALAGEYDLYRAAALDPSTRATLVTAATGSGVPGAAAAVTDNLEVIAASLAEEAVVADAQARLAQYGGLQSAQLQAIQDHQPLMVPLLADVTQWFGVSDLWMEPPMRYRGVLYPHFHTGIDLAAPFDSPIHAAADGMVLSAGTTTNGSGRPVGYGTYVVIAHSTEVITLYGHLDRLAVAAGDQVHQGQIIGLEGSTGMSTGPHLHFELRAGGVPVDPWPFIRNQLPESP
jgi:murein DD-endopeptidase MepM/ murein hydrolase activator NlpD